MYGRLHQRKLKQDDYIMSCQKARSQLDHYIDDEAKRVNIDSAKKRAVLQHMDYDGFRQMVLGANIFPTKTTELQKFTKGENSQIIRNRALLQNGIVEPEKHEKVHTATENMIRQVQGKSELACTSFREFKKKFNQNYPKNAQFSSQQAEQLYTLIKNQDQQRIAKIFNMECEANILVKVVQFFEYIIQYLRENDHEGRVVKQVAFHVKFFETVLKLKTMREFSLSILSKKQRTRIVDFLQKAKSIMTSSVEQSKQQNIEPNEADKEKSIITEKPQIQQQKGLQRPASSDQKIIDQLISILAKK